MTFIFDGRPVFYGTVLLTASGNGSVTYHWVTLQQRQTLQTDDGNGASHGWVASWRRTSVLCITFGIEFMILFTLC